MSGSQVFEKVELGYKRISSTKEKERASWLASWLAYIFTGSSLSLPNPAYLIRSHPIWVWSRPVWVSSHNTTPPS